MNSVTTSILRRLAGFHPLATALIIFLITNIAIFTLLSVWPPLLGWLWLSANRPWGIVTSAFTHVDTNHIMNNIEGFVLAVLFFVLINLNNPRKIRRRLSRRFLLLVFMAGIGANLLEYPLALENPGDASWGASGIVYGALGVVLSSAIQMLPTHINVIMKERRRWIGRGRRQRILKFNRGSLKTLPSLLAFSLFISILLMIIFDMGSFLNVAPDVDVFAHGVGFLLGFIGFTAWQFIGRES